MSKSQNALVVARRSDLNPTFQRQVQLLAEESADLAKSYSDLTTRMLRFAQQFRALWERARALDSDQSNPKHEEYLHAVLKDAVKSQNRSIWSQWNTIGAHAAELLTYKSALPPQRDSLYEMALAVKERRPIKAWVRGEKITSESTVREVKLLRKKRTHKKRHKSHLATVTLGFQSYTEAARVLEDLIKSQSDFTVQSHQAFRDAMKERLGAAGYEKQKTRFT
jgi:hypothetical protein